MTPQFPSPARFGALAAWALIALAAVGCSGAKKLFEKTPPRKDRYLIAPERPIGGEAAPQPATLAIKLFEISAPFKDKGLVYRLTDLKYDSDFYREFFVSPAVMITEATGRWVDRSGVFARVIEGGSGVRSDAMMMGTIRELYGDYRDKTAPAAVISFRVALVRQEGYDLAPVFEKEYARRRPVEGPGMNALAAAWSCALADMLAELETDLRARPWPKAEAADAAKGAESGKTEPLHLPPPPPETVPAPTAESALKPSV